MFIKIIVMHLQCQFKTPNSEQATAGITFILVRAGTKKKYCLLYVKVWLYNCLSLFYTHIYLKKKNGSYNC